MLGILRTHLSGAAISTERFSSLYARAASTTERRSNPPDKECLARLVKVSLGFAAGERAPKPSATDEWGRSPASARRRIPSELLVRYLGGNAVRPLLFGAPRTLEMRFNQAQSRVRCMPLFGRSLHDRRPLLEPHFKASALPRGTRQNDAPPSRPRLGAD